MRACACVCECAEQDEARPAWQVHGQMGPVLSNLLVRRDGKGAPVYAILK